MVLEDHGGAGVSEDVGKSGGKEEHDKARRMEVKPEEWNPEVAGGQRLTKVELEGRGSPVEPVG